jgi:ABC-type antimicrobial peptide transport system permease subunit
LTLAGAGMAIGALGSWMMSRWLSGMLFETTAGDPMTFLGMLLVLGAVSAVAGYLPARRASRIDPSVALRAN